MSVTRSAGNSHSLGGQNQIAERGRVAHSPKRCLVAREWHDELPAGGETNSVATGALVETLDVITVHLGGARVSVGKKNPNLAKLERREGHASDVGARGGHDGVRARGRRGGHAGAAREADGMRSHGSDCRGV